MTKLQRWLDLIAYLVGRRIPVPVEELMERIPAYAEKWRKGDDTARATARRTFERDKDELRAAGIPIRTVPYSVHFGREQIEGYRIDRRDFYLPYLRLVAEPRATGRYGDPARVADVELEPDQLQLSIEAARRAAALPAFPLEREARSALRKLTFDLAGPPADARAPVLYFDAGGAHDLRDTLRLLSDALLLRKRVSFRYHGLYRDEVTDRDVASYGLVFQHGQWYLVGHDALRDDVRVFRVGRMADVRRNTRRPNTADYDVPSDFSLADHVGRRSWELGSPDDGVLHARVLFHFPLGIWAERNGYGALEEQRADGSAVRSFVVRQVDPFVRWVLSCEGEAEIVEPESMVTAVRETAARIAASHGHSGGEVSDG